MNKKATSLLIYTLIGFALVILIVAILLFITSGSFASFIKSNECTNRGGFCTTNCNGAILHLEGCKQEEVCCLNP
jgi:Tfp pilus assembly protein PilE